MHLIVNGTTAYFKMIMLLVYSLNCGKVMCIFYKLLLIISLELSSSTLDVW